MKEFQLIDEVMPDVPPADPARAMALRARMLGGARRRGLPAWSRMALAAAAVAVVLTGGFVVAPMLGGPRIETAARVPDPAAVLGTAADRLAARPPGEGAWWRRDLLRHSRTRTAAGYTVEHRIEEVLWVNREGRRHTDRGQVTTKPLTPADEQAWKDAGSPALCQGSDGCDIGRTYFIPLTLTPVTSLPTEAGALKAEMLKEFPADGADSQESWLWASAKWMLLDAESTPGTRAALYRLLAGLPGFRVADGVTDAEGRAGVAVEYGEQRIIIDRETGELLAVQDEMTSYVVRRLGWTDETPRD
ncbi:CU044_5270 family protein [Nonomuraea sp. NPDC059023]|uniref:CU044_5270 family protein n=1 Tax=unclassified Nonomuraea TaxID=2593643 RepID=UPI00369352C4